MSVTQGKWIRIINSSLSAILIWLFVCLFIYFLNILLFQWWTEQIIILGDLQMNNKSSGTTEGHRKLNEKTFLPHQTRGRSHSLRCKCAPTSRLRSGRVRASASRSPRLFLVFLLRCESERAAVMWTLLPGPVVGVWRRKGGWTSGGSTQWKSPESAPVLFKHGPRRANGKRWALALWRWSSPHG